MANNFKVSENVHLWGGADVVITDAMTKDLELWQGNPPIVIGAGKVEFAGRQVVCTKLAKELSYIFYELKDIFQEYIDYNNKYEFYGRLASAARAYTGTSGRRFRKHPDTKPEVSGHFAG